MIVLIVGASEAVVLIVGVSGVVVLILEISGALFRPELTVIIRFKSLPMLVAGFRNTRELG